MTISRRGIYFNDHWQSWHASNDPSLEDIHRFHTSLPDYKPTPLIKMNDLASKNSDYLVSPKTNQTP
jgi:hypothetical protein